MGYFFRGQFYSETPSLHFPFPRTNPTPLPPLHKRYTVSSKVSILVLGLNPFLSRQRVFKQLVGYILFEMTISQLYVPCSSVVALIDKTEKLVLRDFFSYS